MHAVCVETNSACGFATLYDIHAERRAHGYWIWSEYLENFSAKMMSELCAR